MAKKPQTEHAENKWKSLGVHNLRVSFCFFFLSVFLPKKQLHSWYQVHDFVATWLDCLHPPACSEASFKGIHIVCVAS